MSDDDNDDDTGFDEAYAGVAPWDIGRPQDAFVRLADSGGLVGRVLDVGCGSGEHTLLAAARGHEAVGVDLSPRALELAQSKAAERGLPMATFKRANALDLRPNELGGTFHTVLDSGVFHIFDGAARYAFVRSLARVTRPGGHYHMLVFCDKEPADWGGPGRIRQSEIRSAFRDGWVVEKIIEDRFATNMDTVEGHAWFATVKRI